MSEFVVRLWERAEAAIEKVGADELGGGILPARSMAKAAVVAVLKELSDEVEQAEEDDNESWPDSDDLAMLADELEEKDV